MSLKSTGSFKKLTDRLTRLQQTLPEAGSKWAAKSAETMDKKVREHLDKQGRGGTPPPLTSMTRKIYATDGEPDGSGIVNHLTLEYHTEGSRTVVTLGIPQGKPTMIAKVQDRGETIAVTDKMRGFLAAAYGIYLKESTTHINIPGRHFWEASLKATNRQAYRELRKLFRSTK
jgi:hypothetical protein